VPQLWHGQAECCAAFIRRKIVFREATGAMVLALPELDGLNASGRSGAISFHLPACLYLCKLPNCFIALVTYMRGRKGVQCRSRVEAQAHRRQVVLAPCFPLCTVLLAWCAVRERADDVYIDGMLLQM